MCQPFVVPNQSDRIGLLDVESLTSFSSSAGTKVIDVTSSNVTWSSSIVYNGPTGWISLSNSTGGPGVSNVNISTSSNIGSLRTASIIFNGLTVNGISLSETVNVSQVGNSTDVPLTTLTPTSALAGYGTINYNGLNIGGNDVYIGGIKFTQGIGTHAYSNIKYNIASGYQYFKGKVGRDDSADPVCGDGVVSFEVKLNGTTLWNSGVHGGSTPAEDFQIDLQGDGGVLELIVWPGNDNYCDWASWVNVFLSGTGGSNNIPEPINFYANPGTISGGSTNLFAFCNTGTVSWSTGATGSPVSVAPSSTTSYTIRCVTGPQQSDPRVVTVTVSGSSPCSALTDDLFMGTWNITGHKLVNRKFHGNNWIVQKVNVNGLQYDEFVVRAGQMITRGDISKSTIPPVANMTFNSFFGNSPSCFGLENSAYGGLLGPNNTSTVPFATPAGFQLLYAPDNTPYYTNYNTSTSAITNGNCYRIKSLANNNYLTAVGGDFNEFQSGNSGHTKIWKFTSSDNVNWKMKAGDESNKYLYASGTHYGAGIKRTTNTNQSNQLFRFDQNGSDFRFFLPNGNTWDHEGAGTLTNLQLCGDNTQGFMNFRLVSLESVGCPSGLRVGKVESSITEEEIPFLTVLPNPNNGEFEISLNAESAGVANILMIDLVGRTVLGIQLMSILA